MLLEPLYLLHNKSPLFIFHEHFFSVSSSWICEQGSSLCLVLWISSAVTLTGSHFGSQPRDEEGSGARGLIMALICNYTVIFHTGILTSSLFGLES